MIDKSLVAQPGEVAAESEPTADDAATDAEDAPGARPKANVPVSHPKHLRRARPW